MRLFVAVTGPVNAAVLVLKCLIGIWLEAMHDSLALYSSSLQRPTNNFEPNVWTCLTCLPTCGGCLQCCY